MEKPGTVSCTKRGQPHFKFPPCYLN